MVEQLFTMQTGWRRRLPRCADASCRRTRIWQRACLRREGVELGGRWFCSPQCFEAALRQRLERGGSSNRRPVPARHRIPLGLMMLSRGQLNNHQLRSALEAQRLHGGRIGQWLENMGYATEQQVTAALGLQWACPVLPSLSVGDPRCAQMVPFALLKRFRMLPLRSVPETQTLFVAFSERLHYAALNSIEDMLDCRTQPCLAGSSRLELMLENMGRTRFPGEYLFPGLHDACEMARIAAGYALKLGARRARVANCGEYVWIRLETRSDPANLVFSSMADDPKAGAPLAS